MARAAGLAIAVLVVVTGCLKPDEAYKSIEWPILMLIYAMLAVSATSKPHGSGIIRSEVYP